MSGFKYIHTYVHTYIPPLHSVQARTVAEVQSEKANVESNRMWLLHKDGYSAVNMVNIMHHNRSNLAVQTSLVRHQGRETKRVKLENREVIIEVAEEDLEKVCVRTYVSCEQICMYIRTYICTARKTEIMNVLMYVCTYACIHTFILIYIYVCTYVDTSACCSAVFSSSG